jgi:hypothetical protein
MVTPEERIRGGTLQHVWMRKSAGDEVGTTLLVYRLRVVRTSRET